MGCPHIAPVIIAKHVNMKPIGAMLLVMSIKFFILNKKFQKFIIYKGSISINGVSLTISSVKKDFFSVSLIPETLKRTNLVNLKSNDLVNVEIDIFAKYIENFLKN